MTKIDFLTIHDFSSKEILKFLDVALKFKQNPFLKSSLLKNKSIGLIFQKPSNRTRVSFEVGVHQLGGNCVYLSPEEIDLGRRESTMDVARTLSRYLDGIVARTHTHQDVVDLARYATVPVINGLSDLSHPCQALADLMTIHGYFKKFSGLTLAYIGDGNNVCHSLMMACAKVGISVRIATPEGYEPRRDVVDAAKESFAKSKASLLLTHSPAQAAKGADIFYTDVWVSMGQEVETKKRLNDFKGFQINEKLVGLGSENYIFMHCLPAHRDLEVSSAVMDGAHSLVFDQAENRLHVQKSILYSLMG